MFSELTTMKIIDKIFNLSVETYDEIVKLCKNAINNIFGISHVIKESIFKTVTEFKPVLLTMYALFSLDVIGTELTIYPYMLPRYKVPIEIYRDDDVNLFKKYVNYKNIKLTNSQLLKESIQCNAINITKFLISNGCIFDPVYIHYCWSEEMYSILNDRYHNEIIVYISNKSNIDNYIKSDSHFFFRNKFVKHMIKTVYEDFDYDNYLELNNDEVSLYLSDLLSDSYYMKNYEFIGAVCNHSEPCLEFAFNYLILNGGAYAILGFINDGYRKFFEYLLCDENRLNRIYIYKSNQKCDEDCENLITYYSQDVTDELGRDLCMLLLADPKKITDELYCENICRLIIRLIKLQKINLQKTDINKKTLMDYIKSISHYSSAQELLNLVQ